MKYYHVVSPCCWDGGDLESLHRRYGDQAEEVFLSRWPEAGELAQHHINYVHLYASLSDAQRHQQEEGGQILEINIPDEDIDFWIETDTFESALPHPVVRDYIPRRMVRIWKP